MIRKIAFLVILPLILVAQAGWVSIGPDGGFLLTFAIAPSASNVLYGGCDAYGGIYKSTDGGDHWEFSGMLSEIGHILDIDIHPDSFDIVYAVGGDGLYKTTNGGQNWNHIFSRGWMTYSCGIDPNSPSTVYAGVLVDTAVSNYGLYKSTDGGGTWTDSTLFDPGLHVFDIQFYPESLNSVYIGTPYGVYRSTDAGGNWSWCGPPDPSASVFNVAVVDFNTFYAGTHPDPRDVGSVYKTTNGGVSWDTSYVLGTKVLGLANDPQSTNIAYMAAGNNMFGNEGMFKTTNTGDTWFSINNGLVDRMASKVRIDPVSPNIVYATTDGLGGVYKSTDRGATWTQITSGMRHTIVEAMCFDAANIFYAAIGWGTYRDIPCVFKSTDNGNSWDTLTMIPSPYYMTSIWDIIAHPDSAGVIYVGGLSHYSNTTPDSIQGLICKSSNGGQTWQELWTPDSIQILCLAIDPTTGNLYAGTGGTDTLRVYKVHRSTDNGITWPGTSGWDVGIGNPILDIIIDPASPNILYAGTGGAVFKSTDYGANWDPQYVLPSVYSIIIDPNTTNILYAGSGGPYIDSGGVYKSTDAGDSWDIIGLDEYSIYTLVAKFGATDTLYAGTGGKFLETTGKGVFQSTDNGVTWDSINTSLFAPYVLSLEINPISSNMIYAGTMGGGIFRYNELGMEEEQNYIFNKSIALQIHPNPFNNKTKISFSVGRSAYGGERIALDIYDVTGRLVKSFKLSTLYSLRSTVITWHGDDDIGQKLPSGVYFLQLRTKNESAIEKCLFLR